MNILIWRVLLDRIPTRLNLSNKGIDIPSVLCPFCSNDVETSQHIFLACDIAERIWKLIFKWLNIPFFSAANVGVIFQFIDGLHLKSTKKMCIEGIFCCTIWTIWKYRNDLVFSSGQNRSDFLFDFIVSQSHIWASNKCRKICVSRDEWFQNPLLFL